MVTSAQATRCRFQWNPPRKVGLILAGLCLALSSGCANFTAQGRNAEGVRLHQQARYQEALQQFQEATYTDPANPDGYYNLAATYHRLGLAEGNESYLRQAENFYHMCLDTCQQRGLNYPDCYRGLAVLLAEQGREEEAFRLLEGWVDREPGVADPKIELARLFEEFGDRAAAKEHLIEALAVEPDNARALTALGKIREEMGEPAQALADYERSLWHDRFQPQVASRIAALRSSITPPLSITAPEGGTRLVDRPSGSLR